MYLLETEDTGLKPLGGPKQLQFLYQKRDSTWFVVAQRYEEGPWVVQDTEAREEDILEDQYDHPHKRFEDGATRTFQKLKPEEARLLAFSARETDPLLSPELEAELEKP